MELVTLDGWGFPDFSKCHPPNWVLWTLVPFDMLDILSEGGGTPRSAKSGKNPLLLPTLRDSR